MKEMRYIENKKALSNKSRDKDTKEVKPVDWETLFRTTPTVDLRKERVKEEDWAW